MGTTFNYDWRKRKKMRKHKIINKELNLVHMNEKKFKVLDIICQSKNTIHLRGIVKGLSLPYGTVQGIINKNLNLFETKVIGKNKYFSLKKNLNYRYLIQEIEIGKTKNFIEKHKFYEKFFIELINLKLPIIIFGSYAKSLEDENSDLDLLIFTENKNIKLPDYIFPNEIHSVKINPKNIDDFKKEVLYKEILENHIIIYGFDYFLNEVFN
jgi:predicted nucleotidyltransferase